MNVHNVVYDPQMDEPTLAEQLGSTRDAASGRRADDEKAIREAAVEAIRQALITAPPLGLGDTLPSVRLQNHLGESVDLAGLLDDGPLVITFYRGGWCPYCNLALRALQHTLADVVEAGAQLVAITPELPDNSLTTAQKNALEFPVLSDPDNVVGRAFGIVFPIADDIVAMQLAGGRDVAAHNGSEIAEVPLPATYVIDRDRVIRYAFVDADHTARAEPADIVRAVAGLFEN